VQTVETVQTVQTAHLWCKTVETVSRPEGPKAVSPGHRPGYKVSAANALQGQPMEQREQCEHAQTLPSRERLRVGEHSSGIRGRQSQKNLLCNNAFALSCVPSVASDQRSSAGRTFVQRFYPGRCPGLTAAAPLGRFPSLA